MPPRSSPWVSWVTWVSRSQRSQSVRGVDRSGPDRKRQFWTTAEGGSHITHETHRGGHHDQGWGLTLSWVPLGITHGTHETHGSTETGRCA